jgi:hypothetical protein
MAYTTPLCPLMDKYGSDKGPRKGDSTHHTYTEVYYELFKGMVERRLNVFEMGLGTNNTNFPANMGPNGRPGASLRGWSEYFPHSSIYGADIDKGVLFEEDRIHTTYCDQTNPSIVRSMWESLPDMDIIIDDGLHTFEANVTLFENSIQKLKHSGIYVIEDLHTSLCEPNKMLYGRPMENNLNKSNTTLHYLQNEPYSSEYLTQDENKYIQDNIKSVKIYEKENDHEWNKSITSFIMKKSKIKLLYITPHLSTGGMPQFVLKRIESLQKYNDEIEMYE